MPRYHYCILRFALPGAVITGAYMFDIEEAISHVNINLLKYRTHLSEIERVNEFIARFRILTFDSRINRLCREDKMGNHLNGISKYLLKTYPEKYNKMKVGTRLFYIDTFYGVRK